MTFSRPALVVAAFLVLGLAFLPETSAAQAPPDVVRTITQIGGDLFEFRDGSAVTVLMVTPEGIVLADPLTRAAALWLRDELAVRFPNTSVRYVLHGSSRVDRAEGASVFGDTAEIIAHRDFNDEVSKDRRELPIELVPFDTNGNGTLERAEWIAQPAIAAAMPVRDRDGNGTITTSEYHAFVRDVRSTFDGRRTVTLAGRSIDLVHTGPWGTEAASVVYFRNQRLAFASMTPAVLSPPYALGDSRPAEVLRWMRTVASLGADSLRSGDGATIAAATVASAAEYFDEMSREVADAWARGTGLAQLQATLVLGAFAQQPFYSARPGHIAAFLNSTKPATVALTGVMVGNYVSKQATYCSAFNGCSTGGAIPMGTVGLTLSLGRVGISAEGTAGGQLWSSRTSVDVDEEFAFREARLAVLAGYTKPIGGRSAIAFGAGPAFIIGDALGVSRVKNALAPRGGRHPISAHATRFGLAFGVDVLQSIGSRFALTIPIRFIQVPGEAGDAWPVTRTVTVGGGLSMRVLRRIR